MKKSSIMFIIIIIILVITLGFMTYSRFFWKNANKGTTERLIQLVGGLEKAGVVVLFSQSGDSKVVIREENNVVLEKDWGDPLDWSDMSN